MKKSLKKLGVRVLIVGVCTLAFLILIAAWIVVLVVAFAWEILEPVASLAAGAFFWVNWPVVFAILAPTVALLVGVWIGFSIR